MPFAFYSETSKRVYWYTHRKVEGEIIHEGNEDFHSTFPFSPTLEICNTFNFKYLSNLIMMTNRFSSFFSQLKYFTAKLLKSVTINSKFNAKVISVIQISSTRILCG